ncbi:MAG: helicase C-terminal domain-containing protein [Bacillota bacterium]
MRSLERIYREDLLRLRPSFQIRQGQLDMAHEVHKFLESEDNCFIEAGTGVGKSLGYLIPAASWVLNNDKKVVIATYTKALQNQLIEKDLPLVQELFGKKNTLKVVMVKGRSNYVCLRRLRSISSLSAGEDFHQLKLWSDNGEKQSQLLQVMSEVESGVGERGEFAFSTSQVWDDICSQSLNCLRHRCPWKKQCFVQKARESLAQGQLLVVNHALFFADLAIKSEGSSLLPDYDKVIFDEAHHLEDVIAEAFGLEAGITRIRHFLNAFTNPFSNIGQAVRLNEGFYRDIMEKNKTIVEEAERIFREAGRMLKGAKVTSYPRELLEDSSLPDRLIALVKYVSGPEVSSILQLSFEGEAELENLVAAGSQLAEEIKFLFASNSEEYVYWLEEEEIGDYGKVRACPVEPGNILKEEFFSEVNAMFTSATLTIGGSFAYFAQRLGLVDYTSKICVSPFNFQEQCLLYIPEGGVNPKSPAYDDYIVKRCQEILLQSQGRAFILFTSYTSMNNCFMRLKDWLLAVGLEPMIQSRGITSYRLLELFKTSLRPVLFGTSSFWEGVDVPGEQLSSVIVTKLPFAVPTHPLEEARIKRLRLQGKNDFLEYSVPKAVLKLKQGFGRLIRTNSDTGIVAILDNRILQSFYGQYFLKSLPKVVISHDYLDIGRFLAKRNVD